MNYLSLPADDIERLLSIGKGCVTGVSFVSCPELRCPELRCPGISCPPVTCPLCQKCPKKPNSKCLVSETEFNKSILKTDRFQHHPKLICSGFFGRVNKDAERLIRDVLIDSKLYPLFCKALTGDKFRTRVTKLEEKAKLDAIIKERVEKLRMAALRDLQKKVKTETTSLRNCRKRFPLDWHTCGMVCLNYANRFCI